jgi:hypothetical protein
VLRTEPSLTSLTGQGWRLDRLPVTSTALAFAGALFIGWLSLGLIATIFVLIGIVLTVLLAVSALVMRDVAAARGTLTCGRVFFLAMIVASACLLWRPVGTGQPIHGSAKPASTASTTLSSLPGAQIRPWTP